MTVERIATVGGIVTGTRGHGSVSGAVPAQVDLGTQLGLDPLGVFLLRLIGAAVVLLAAFAVGRWLGGKGAALARRADLGAAVLETPLGALFERPAGVEATVNALVRLLVYVVGVTTAASLAGFGRLYELLVRLSTYFPSVIGAVLVVLVGFVAAGYVGRSIRASDVVGHREFGPALAAGVKAVVYFVTVTLALDALGFSTAILNTLATGVALGLGLGIALAVGIGVGMGSKDYVAECIDEWAG